MLDPLLRAICSRGTVYEARIDAQGRFAIPALPGVMGLNLYAGIEERFSTEVAIDAERGASDLTVVIGM